MRRVASRSAVLAVTVALARAGDLQAAGFALKEQSPGAQGNAFAGATAGGEKRTKRRKKKKKKKKKEKEQKKKTKQFKK